MLESNTRYPFIIHLFISLPNPSDDLINNLQKRFFSFVWNSKTDRIKRDVLTQEYNAGGLYSEPGSNCYIPFSVKEILKNK